MDDSWLFSCGELFWMGQGLRGWPFNLEGGTGVSVQDRIFFHAVSKPDIFSKPTKSLFPSRTESDILHWKSEPQNLFRISPAPSIKVKWLSPYHASGVMSLGLYYAWEWRKVTLFSSFFWWWWGEHIPSPWTRQLLASGLLRNPTSEVGRS